MAFNAVKGGVIVAVTPNGREIVIDDPTRRSPDGSPNDCKDS
jgi:hypothetical protein